MFRDKNERKQKAQREHVEMKREEGSLPVEISDHGREAAQDSAIDTLTADQLAIIYVCQRGQQNLLSILQGVNATRVPIGKTPLDDKTVLPILEELVEKGYLKKGEFGEQLVWTVTPKAQELES
jgi:hypothetical protein